MESEMSHFLHFCVQPGFNVNAELLNGRNGLHYAADYGQADVVQYLCNYSGAKIDVSML